MLQGQRRGGDGKRSDDHDGGMAEREHKPDSDRPFVLLHQFACDVVDGRNMVRVHSVAESKTVGQERSAQQHRKAVKRDERPPPRRQIEPQQKRVQGYHFAFGAARPVIQQIPQKRSHWVPIRCVQSRRIGNSPDHSKRHVSPVVNPAGYPGVPCTRASIGAVGATRE